MVCAQGALLHYKICLVMLFLFGHEIFAIPHATMTLRHEFVREMTLCMKNKSRDDDFRSHTSSNSTRKFYFWLCGMITDCQCSGLYSATWNLHLIFPNIWANQTVVNESKRWLLERFCLRALLRPPHFITTSQIRPQRGVLIYRPIQAF